MKGLLGVENTFRPKPKSTSNDLYATQMHSYDHIRQKKSPKYFFIGPFLEAVGQSNDERLIEKILKTSINL